VTKAESPQDVQVVTRHRPKTTRFLRAVPITAFFPHDGQLEVRTLFAEAAEKAEGREGLCPCHQLPWAAHYVLEETARSRVKRPTLSPLKEWEKRLITLEEALRRLTVAVAQAKPTASASANKPQNNPHEG